MDKVVEQVSGREVAIRELNSMRGRLCTVIESLGLPEKQERAIILLIKNLSFQNQAQIVRLFEELDPEEQEQFTLVNNKLVLN